MGIVVMVSVFGRVGVGLICVLLRKLIGEDGWEIVN